MKVVALVPLKLNNERLPNKNTKSFENGKPLISYILETLISVTGIDEVYVYCSQERIKEYLPAGVKYLKRSESLDQSSTKMNEVISAFIRQVESDVYLLAHATSPFISKISIEKGIKAVLTGEYDSALAVRRLNEFLWDAHQPINYDPGQIPRTQDLPLYYMETSGFYIFHKELSLQYNRRIGFKPALIEVPKIEAIDIDDAEDFIIANAVFNNIIQK